MIPSSSKAFAVNNLVSGTRYDLCVLAAWDDSATTLTATSVVGCVQFFTRDDYPQCQSMHGQLLGGTMILVVGGVIVATLLVFIVILMVRYKAGEGGAVDGAEPPVSKLSDVSDTCSQTNGGRLGPNGVLLPPPKPKPKVTMRDEVVDFKCGSLQSSLSSASSSSSSSSSCGSLDAAGTYSPNSALASIWRSANPKPRGNLDHLLGAITSLELRGQTREVPPPTAGTTPGPPAAAATPGAQPQLPPTDKEPLLGRTLDSRLSKLLMLPLDSKPKRSHSFDMGEFAASTGAQLCNYQRRFSNIWTKRSLSINGMLLKCDEEGGVLSVVSCGAVSCGQRPVPTDEGLEDDQHCTVQQQMSYPL
ncbi:hypothetical protein NFI96_003111 [Prochilodus magdalenae]|nr:hypothetical protein NFI96_003111 [Prochilodus magdalenae]